MYEYISFDMYLTYIAMMCATNWTQDIEHYYKRELSQVKSEVK